MSRVSARPGGRAKYAPRHREQVTGPSNSVRVLTAGSVALTLAPVMVGLAPGTATVAHASSTTTPKAPTYPTPVPAKALPKTLDMVSPYIPQDSCDPVEKPGVAAFQKLILATYKTGFSDGAVRECYIGETSEHKEGRAWDWAIPATTKDHATAQHVVDWLTADNGAMARRFGIMYIIWNRHIWGVYRMSDGWRPYVGESAHTDHVHFSFSWDGAEKRTSWWTGVPVTVADRGPCAPYIGQPAPLYTGKRTTACPAPKAAPKSSYSLVWPGQSTSSVKVAQKALKIKVDGTFGAATRTALISWQKTHALPVTGVLDKATWAKLVPASTVPTPPKPPVTPPPSGGTTSTSGSSIPTLDQLAHTTSLTPYLKTVLRQGSHGAAVKALQQALTIKPVDGEFGPITAKAVKAFQTSQHLPATGVVDATTWTAVQKVAYPLLPYRSIVLKQGSTGATVKVLQKALKVTADGEFGPITAAAVKAAQKSAHLTATGVVAVRTWIAIEAQAYPFGAKRW
jgi:peptidoglycan hydrolase-like protein with peptidoglycan-binding domain